MKIQPTNLDDIYFVYIVAALSSDQQGVFDNTFDDSFE